MMKCKFCGASNEDETYFCEACGKLLETDAPSPAVAAADPPAPASAPMTATPTAFSPAVKTTYCTKCGAQVSAGSSFCSGCGAALAAPVVSPAQHSAAPMVSAHTSMPQTAAPIAAMPATNAPSQKISEFTVCPYAVNMNLMVGAIGPLRSGKLEIFTDKICFTPGKMNLVDAKHTISMSDIVSVELCTVFMFQTALKVTTRGDAYTYITGIAGVGGKCEQIADAIRRQMAAPASPG